jgi:hypothetical protein
MRYYILFYEYITHSLVCAHQKCRLGFQILEFLLRTS